MTYYTATAAAAQIGVDKSTVSRHLARNPKLGLRAGTNIVLTAADVKKLRRLIERAKPGNPGRRDKAGRFR